MSISLNNSTATDSSFSKYRQPAKKKCLSDYEETFAKNKNTSELGTGSYGCVRLVKDKDDNGLFAMKIVNIYHFPISI